MFPRLHYALLHTSCHDKTTTTVLASSTNHIDRSIVWGTYCVQKYHVVVKAQQSWQQVQLDMTICPEYNKLHGRFGYLSFDKHTTSLSGNWEMDCINHIVPNEPYRFVPDRRL
jgi:hypothetical protein